MTAMVLARNEWIKTTKRFAFWVTLLCLGGLTSLMVMDRKMSGLSQENVSLLQLPDGWSYILSEPGPLPGMFAAVLMILLVANEFSWRTARQNVIDGLSREQFYAGKTILLPAVSLAIVLLVSGLGAGIALWGMDLTHLQGPLVGPNDLSLMGGGFLATLGMGSMALLLAVTLRSGGPAIALLFLYMSFGERILAQLLHRFVPSVDPLLPFRPFELFMTLTQSEHYYPAVQEAAVAQAVEQGREAPVFMDPGIMSVAATAWVAAFIFAGFLAFRRRDL